MATSLSHVRLLMKMLANDWEMMLVLEDDALVTPSFFRHLAARMCRLPDNWDALMLQDCTVPKHKAVGYKVALGVRMYKSGVCLAVRPAHARGTTCSVVGAEVLCRLLEL
jgi:GR25 family glycosyltransferase involved in LPS biosynthesis